jgi:ribosomal protein L31
MKKDIHPEYKPFTIIFNDGTKFTTNSAASAKELVVDVDYRTHAAWNPEARMQFNQNEAKVANFNKKFAGLSILSGKKTDK